MMTSSVLVSISSGFLKQRSMSFDLLKHRSDFGRCIPPRTCMSFSFLKQRWHHRKKVNHLQRMLDQPHTTICVVYVLRCLVIARQLEISELGRCIDYGKLKHYLSDWVQAIFHAHFNNFKNKYDKTWI